MDITKSTLWGALALVVLAIAIFGYRNHLLSERNDCGKRLERIAYRLDHSLKAGDKLPATLDGLRKVIGDVPASTVDHQPYRINLEPLHWRQGAPQPYLWDGTPHPKINGIHVLGTDGKVRQLKRLEDFPK
jgi:hypothetical protein